MSESPTYIEIYIGNLEAANSRLKQQLATQEADKERLVSALEQLAYGNHIGTPINRGSAAMTLIEEAIAKTKAKEGGK